MASWRSLFQAFWEVFLEACPGAFKNHVFSCFSSCFCVLFWFSFCSSLGFLAATPAAKRTLKNHAKPLVFSRNLLGHAFCAKCKENKFQSTGARKTERNTSQKTASATCGKMLQKSMIFERKWLQNRSKIAPRGSRKAKETQRDAKSRPRETKNDQKAPQERPKSDFNENPTPSGRVRPG